MSKANCAIIVPPAYTGVVFLFCWTYLVFYATSAGIEAAAPISLYSAGYTTSAIAMVTTLVLVGFARIDRTALLSSKPVKAATGLALPVSTAMLFASGNASSVPALIVSGITTGVFSGVMLMQWIVAYQRVGLRVAVGSFPLLVAMSVAVCATLMYLPREAMALAALAFPIVSEVMFHQIRKQPWPSFDDIAADVKDRPVNFVLILLPFTVYALASGFLDFSSTDNGYTFAFYAFGAFVPVVVSGVYLFTIERERFAGAFLAPAGVLVAVCVPFLSLASLTPLSQFISIGELGIEVLIFIVPIGFAQFFSLDALKTYALCRMVYVVFNGVGWYLANLASDAFGGFMHSQLALVIVFVGVEVLAVCLIVAIVKANKILPGDDVAGGSAAEDGGAAGEVVEGEVAAREGEAAAAREDGDGTVREGGDGPVLSRAVAEAGAAAGSGPAAATEAKADAICAEYGLSQRERDVFVLLARGYTSPRIQQELYIAAGTVNYHCRNIYAKLGVHSKQELIALFESPF